MLCAITTNTIGVQVKLKLRRLISSGFQGQNRLKIIRNAIDVQVKL